MYLNSWYFGDAATGPDDTPERYDRTTTQRWRRIVRSTVVIFTWFGCFDRQHRAGLIVLSSSDESGQVPLIVHERFFGSKYGRLDVCRRMPALCGQVAHLSSGNHGQMWRTGTLIYTTFTPKRHLLGVYRLGIRTDRDSMGNAFGKRCFNPDP